MFKQFINRSSQLEQKNIPVSAFIIYKREASWLVAAFLILCLLSFLAGYFMGQRKAVRAFVQQTSEEALLEQAQPDQGQLEQPQLEQGKEAEESEPQVNKDASIKYYAPLMVNDNYGRAVHLVDKAHKQNIELRIKKSFRKLKNGKRKVTYQIISSPYSDKEALKNDLETLKTLPEFKQVSINIRQLTQKD